jgi:L,D-transpeptidase ErfK/SrfK
MPGAGTTILLPTQYILPDGPQTGVVLNVASRRLFYYPPVVEGHRSVLTYPIGVGREGWDTPLGRTSIIAKTRDPAWNVPASIRAEHAAEGDPLPAVVPPGPDNPLGRYALRLGKSSYLLHGTNKPAGVGMRVSHGCVRLYPENIEQLFRLVDVGDRVTIVNQPYLLAWHQGELYVEAHRLPEDDVVNPERRLQALFDRAAAESDAFPGMSAEVQLFDVVVEARGVPVRLLRENVDQVVDRARSVQNLLAVNDIEPADLVY